MHGCAEPATRIVLLAAYQWAKSLAEREAAFNG